MSDPLETMAAWAADQSFFLAAELAAYARSEDLDDAGLAVALGCSLEDLTMLRLCRTPRTERDEFLEDVAAIAERFGLDPQRLAEAVRRGRVIRRLQVSGPAGGLMAARDRDDEPPGEP